MLPVGGGEERRKGSVAYDPVKMLSNRYPTWISLKEQHTEWPGDGSSNLEVRQDNSIVHLNRPEPTEICVLFLRFNDPIIIFSFQVGLQ